MSLFFLCSGITSSGKIKKSINRLLKTQVSYTLFIIILFFLSIFLGYAPSYTLLLKNICHNYILIPPFYCAYYSLWFLVVFFLVTLSGSIILTITQSKKIINIIIVALFLVILYSSFNKHVIEKITYESIFYLFIFLLGYQLKNIKLSKTYFLIGIALASIILYFWFSGPNHPLIAVYKFPPDIIYLTASSFSILFTLFLRTRIKIKPNNIFLYPGRESLFFYFAQGISITITSGLILLLVRHSVKWYLVFLLGVTLNIAITYILVIVLKYIDSLMWKALKNIRIPRTRI